MSKRQSEWRVIPEGAKWTAAAVCAGMVLLMWLVIFPQDDVGPPIVKAMLTFVGPLTLAAGVLLIGYVYGDAKRRQMRHIMWTLLAIFVPNAIGIILYFILRDPLPEPCPSCSTSAKPGYVFCPKCGFMLKPTCLQCGKAVERMWANCAYCGTKLNHPAQAA